MQCYPVLTLSGCTACRQCVPLAVLAFAVSPALFVFSLHKPVRLQREFVSHRLGARPGQPHLWGRPACMDGATLTLLAAQRRTGEDLQEADSNPQELQFKGKGRGAAGGCGCPELLCLKKLDKRRTVAVVRLGRVEVGECVWPRVSCTVQMCQVSAEPFRRSAPTREGIGREGRGGSAW